MLTIIPSDRPIISCMVSLNVCRNGRGYRLRRMGYMVSQHQQSAYTRLLENIHESSPPLPSCCPEGFGLRTACAFHHLTSEGFSKQYPEISKALGAKNRPKQVQSSLSAFHTMLGNCGIQTHYRLDEYSVAKW